MLQPIKEDLGLSDTQLGFLTGIAFAIFYTCFAIPIARWAERLARKDERWYLWLPAIATLMTIPFVAVTYLWPDPTVALR